MHIPEKQRARYTEPLITKTLGTEHNRLPTLKRMSERIAEITIALWEPPWKGDSKVRQEADY